MIELTNSVAQVVQPGQSVAFNTVVLHTGCGECYRRNTPSIKLRANGIYEVAFSGNITGSTAATPVQLGIALGGIALPETVMVSTPATANAFSNVATSTFVQNTCGDFDRVTVVNSGTEPVTISANMKFSVRRLS